MSIFGDAIDFVDHNFVEPIKTAIVDPIVEHVPGVQPVVHEAGNIFGEIGDRLDSWAKEFAQAMSDDAKGRAESLSHGHPTNSDGADFSNDANTDKYQDAQDDYNSTASGLHLEAGNHHGAQSDFDDIFGRLAHEVLTEKGPHFGDFGNDTMDWGSHRFPAAHDAFPVDDYTPPITGPAHPIDHTPPAAAQPDSDFFVEYGGMAAPDTDLHVH